MLFVCVHNSGRSQIAAVLLTHRAGDRAEVRSADHVITLGCGDACPVYAGKHYLDWEIPDPSTETLEGVRAAVGVGRAPEGPATSP